MLQKQGRLTFLCKFSKQIIIPDTVYNAFIVGINLPIQRSIIKPQPLSIEHHSDNELFAHLQPIQRLQQSHHKAQ